MDSKSTELITKTLPEGFKYEYRGFNGMMACTECGSTESEWVAKNVFYVYCRKCGHEWAE